MFLILLVASNAAKVGRKTIAGTFGAFLGVVGLVFCMGMFALATRFPLVDIKSLSSDEPPLPHFLRSSRNKCKHLTVTTIAIRLEFFAGNLLLVFAPETPTEASRHGSNSKAIVFGLRTSPRNVYTVHLRFLSVLKLPSHHLGSTRSWTNVSDNLKDGFFVISLC